MKKLNVKLLLILVAVLGVAGAGIYLLHGWQVRRNASVLLGRAEQAEASGQLADAADLLHRYMKHRPDDIAALSRLAILQEQLSRRDMMAQADVDSLHSVLERALRSDPENQRLRLHAVEFYLRIGRAKDALDHLKFLIAQQGERTDPRLEYFRARCAMGSSEHELAAHILEKIIGYRADHDDFHMPTAVDPNNLPAYEDLARLCRSDLSRPEFADRVMDQMVAANDKSAAAYLVRSRYLSRYYPTGSPPDAQSKQDIHRALALSPQNADALRAAAELALADREAQQAEALLKTALEAHPDNDVFYVMHARLALIQNDTGRAMQIVEAGLKRLPKSWELRLFRADLDLSAGNFDRAAVTVADLRNSRRLVFMGDYLQARIHLERKEWLAASRQLQKVLPALVELRPDLAIIGYLALAHCYEKMGQWDRQRDAARQALRLDPKSLSARWAEVRALARVGKTNEARTRLAALYRDAQAQNVSIPGLTAMARSLQASRPGNQPRKAATEEQLQAHFQTLVNDAPQLSDLERAGLYIQLLIENEHYEQAEERLQRALRQFPKDQRFWLMHIDLAASLHGPDVAIESLTRARVQLGDTVTLRLMEAQLQLARGKADSALKGLAQDVEHFSNEDKEQLWRTLGMLHFRQRHYAEAERLWRLVAELRPDDLAIRLGLFQSARDNDDASAMEEALDEIAKVAGQDSATWKFAEANHLVWRVKQELAEVNDLARAKRLIKEARQQRNEWHLLSLLEADIALAEGDRQQCIRQLQQALELGPDDPQVIRQLVELLVAERRYDDARDVMDRLQAAGRLTMHDQRRLSRTEAAAGDRLSAIENARQIASTSQSAGDHLWLGRLLLADGQTEQGEAAIRKAIELEPAFEDARLELVRSLIASGRREQAASEVRQSALDLPQNDAPILLAQCYDLLGDAATAEQHYLAALAANDEDASLWRLIASHYLLFNQLAKAKPYLDRLTDHGQPYSGRDHPAVTWARRIKAQLLATSLSYRNYQAGVELIEQNVPKGEPLSAEDLLIATSLATRRADVSSKQQAIARLQSIKQSRALSRSELLLFAQLLESVGRWPEASDVLSDLATDDPANDTLLITWCRLKIKHDDLPGALQQLKQLPADSPQVKRLRARVLAHQGQPAEAARLIRSLLPADLTPNTLPAVSETVELMEELKLIGPATELLQKFVANNPEHEFMLAQFLGRHGQLEEAFEICRRHLNGQNILFASRTALTALTANRRELDAHAAQIGEVADWLALAARRLPDSRNVLLQQAMFEDLRGDAAKASELYRRFLSLPSATAQEKALVDNNLAVLLAQQGDCDQALESVQRAIEEFGPTAELLDTRAMCFLCRGDKASLALAIRDLQTAMLTSSQGVISYHLSLAHHLQGNREASQQTLRQAESQGFHPKDLSTAEQAQYRLLQTALTRND